MKRLVLLAIAAGATLATAIPAEARQGCGAGFHRTPRGACVSNRVGGFYQGHGYWDGHRYWKQRYRWHGGWRYR